MIDAAWRLAFRLGHPVMRQWWRLTRPDARGAHVAVWLGGELLVVRQSYRRGLSLPGGGVKRGEPPVRAARRELGEELGLTVREDALSPVAELDLRWEHRQDRVSMFTMTLTDIPALTIDDREIIAADFMTPAAILADQPAPYLRAYLEGLDLTPDR